MGSHRVGHDWSDLAATFHFAYTLHLLNHPSINGHLDCFYGFSSVQFSHSVMSDSLQHHEPQHSRPTIHHQLLESTQTHVHRVSDAISSSVIPFSSCLQSFPASGSFQMSLFFPSGGQSIGASVSASVLLMNIQGWFPLGWTGWISLLSKEFSRVFSNTTFQNHQFFGAQLSLYKVQLSHLYMATGKTIALTIQTFVSKMVSLLFSTLSRFVIAFLPRSKPLLMSWLHHPQWIWSPRK